MPRPDQLWDTRQRHETATQRLDRNWSGLLQELRVTQTGVQLLTGFLLTLPFQQRFAELDIGIDGVYLATVGASVAATVLLVAPVGMHRLLFRRHRVAVLVQAAHRCAFVGVLLLGCALVGATVVVVDAVAGLTPAEAAGGAVAVLVMIVWLVVPVVLRVRCARHPDGGEVTAEPAGRAPRRPPERSARPAAPAAPHPRAE